MSTVILVDSYERTPFVDDDGLNEHIRLSNALSSSGLSITLTSLCSAMAFFVGSAIDIPGVSSFCIYAACSFLANYVLQFLIFVPLMVIDDRRIRKKRNFCCPCCCGYDDTEKAMVNVQSAGSSVPSNSRSSMTTSSELHIEPVGNQCDINHFHLPSMDLHDERSRISLSHRLSAITEN